MNGEYPNLPHLEIVKFVGEGGMAKVYKARDLKRGEIVAVKVLKEEFNSSEQDTKSFIREAQVLEQLTHPNIIKAYRQETTDDGRLFYVMEFVDGYNYAAYLGHRPQAREEDCLAICEAVASSLCYAWNEYRLVHCDIKPDNIMINSSGIVKLTDLGLCHIFKGVKPGSIKAPDHVLGTPAYISPEQVYGDVELDCRTDIYSLAATMYHLASGQTLFTTLSVEDSVRAHCNSNRKSNDPRVYNHNLSEGFAQLLEAMLIKDRRYRPNCWEDVLEMCAHVMRGGAFKPRGKDAPSSSIRLL